MNKKSCYPVVRRSPRTEVSRTALFLRIFLILGAMGVLPPPQAAAADAPSWMHVQAGFPLPAHDEKTNAVLLYSERVMTVQSSGKIETLEREAYKILRPEGKEYGIIRVYFDSQSRINYIHGWCIPAQGKDYEVKDKDAIESALTVENGELMTDVRMKTLQIPASDPGSIVGYEVEQEERPYVMEGDWLFQREVPVRESHFTLQIPSGWEYKAVWMNHPEVAPAVSGGQNQWALNDVKAIRPEEDMPPWSGVAGEMVLELLPPNGFPNRGFANWSEMGLWYLNLTSGRRDASPQIKQEAALLAASATTPAEKMKAFASFLQNDIRYVGIELGIGGQQPHPAAEVFTKRYGDCKDKVTLLSSMLKEIGVESYYVLINTERGAVTPATPANIAFNHAILAIQLPAGLSDPSWLATLQHPKLGKLLFFDPTDHLTPFGQIRGELQANYGLLVTPNGGELVELPEQATSLTAIQRTAKFTIDEKGVLQGDVHEVRLGDQAMRQRYALRSATRDVDQIKPIETLLSHAFTSYRITKASVSALHVNDLPFEYHYSLIADNYAKVSGDLVLIRPRVLGTKSNSVLETREPRLYPFEFRGPERDEDVFEIEIPATLQADDLPSPVHIEYDFADYQSKTEVVGHTLRYTRTFEIKQLSVPASRAEDLKKFYRIIANDERSTAVFKRVP